MIRYQVTPLNYPNQVRILEAARIALEEGTNAVLFYDDEDTLVARRYNVEIERIVAADPGDVASIAADYLNITAEEMFFDTREDREKAAADIRSMAGSVLGRA